MHHNKLSDSFIMALSKTVTYDQYLRVIDLRFNKISEKSLNIDLLPALKNNSSLTNVDLRHNAGYT